MDAAIGCIITARVKSSRLHEKVLQKINGKYTIDILLDHVIPNDDLYPVVMAIPENSDDDILAQIAENRGVMVYRGQDDSPLHRLYECAIYYDLTDVIRITADDILIDQNLLRTQIRFHQKGGYDYTFMKRCPEGIAGEIISVDALKQVIDKVGKKPVEFISYYLKTKDFSYKEYYPPTPGADYQFSFRLTMDYEEDLILLRIIYACLTEPFGTLDIINFLKSHKYLLNINKQPDITLYTCNYNTGKYIIECMKSVLSQTIRDFEYIIIDDCSSDNSMNMILEFYTKLDRHDQNKVRILRNEKNIGLPACCNKIINMARGKYICRIDSDDIILPNAIEKMCETIRMEDTAGCISGYYETKEALSITAEVIESKFHPACCVLSTWCVNELRYKEDLKYLEGKEFFDRFNKEFRVSFIEQPLWMYRKHESQKTAQPDHPLNGGL